MASAPAKPPPLGWQGHEPAIHKHVGAPTVHQACATEARSGELTRPWQTGHAPGTAGPGGRQPGQAPPGSAGSEGHGGGKAAAGACYLGGGHLTPPSACFLICKMGEILSAPQGRCEGQMEDDTSAPSTRPGPDRTGSTGSEPRPGQDSPCHDSSQPHWGHGRAGAHATRAHGAGRGGWLLTVHPGRCPKSTCEQGSPGPSTLLSHAFPQ